MNIPSHEPYRQRHCGGKRFLTVIILLAGLLATSAVADTVPPPQSSTYALVIGVSYPGEDDFSVQEARSMFQLLTDPEVGLATETTSTLMLGATGVDILKVIEGYRSKLRPGDTLIFFWAGHMSSRASSFAPADEKVMLHPVDSSGSNGERNVPLDYLVRAAESNDANLIIMIGDSSIGPFPAKVAQEYSRLGILSASYYEARTGSHYDQSLFFTVLQDALRDPNTDNNGDGLVSVQEVFKAIYPKIETFSAAAQIPGIAGLFVDQLWLGRSPLPSTVLKFAADIPEDIRSEDKMLINNVEVAIDRKRSGPRELVLLGGSREEITGLTWLSTGLSAAKRKVQSYYMQGGSLKSFANPYSGSAAIIVAIDDYERLHDPLRRGKTGYDSRAFMVQRAEEFRATLMRLGFAKKNITTLYNEKATSSAIESALKSFWSGGGRQADRLVFYFGGHGDAVNGTGVLITYDFDPKRPTLSGFLMRDLATRHAENIAARHVLFAIDACASGLAVYLGGVVPSTPPGPSLDMLSVIRNDTAEKARNILVAGIEARPALWDKGGIFTQALIEGLKGNADPNGDGIIQFRELETYVSNRVATWANRLDGAQQTIGGYVLDNYGAGKIVFLTKSP